MPPSLYGLHSYEPSSYRHICFRVRGMLMQDPRPLAIGHPSARELRALARHTNALAGASIEQLDLRIERSRYQLLKHRRESTIQLSGAPAGILQEMHSPVTHSGENARDCVRNC